MNLKKRIQTAVEQGDLAEIGKLLADEPRALRYLAGMIYQPDEKVQDVVALAIAEAAEVHTKRVSKLIERLIWAMNTDSCTNAMSVPKIFHAIAQKKPELLLPVIPKIVVLATDTGLYPGLCDTLRKISEQLPGEVSQRMSKTLEQQVIKGGCCGPVRNR